LGLLKVRDRFRWENVVMTMITRTKFGLILVVVSSLAFAQSSPNKSALAESKSVAQNKRSVMDRPVGEKPDPYVVPAGTEIRVDLLDSKVIVPVRLGFATPIPALSKVAVQTDRAYYPTAYFNTASGYIGYGNYATLTAVTIGNKTYPLQCNRVQVDGVSLANGPSSGSSRDAVFILSAPVSIER
jgi:hypothetical protein